MTLGRQALAPPPLSSLDMGRGNFTILSCTKDFIDLLYSCVFADLRNHAPTIPATFDHPGLLLRALWNPWHYLPASQNVIPEQLHNLPPPL